MRYLMQFPAGATALVERAVEADFSQTYFEYSDDSALIFETDTKIRTARAVRYAKNVFIVHAQTPRRAALGASIMKLSAEIPSLRNAQRSPGFRIMYHIDGQLVSCEPRVRQAIERSVAAASGARLAPRGQCQEYWVIGRRNSDILYFAERLDNVNPPKRAKGALSAELSALLVAASEPSAHDVFLDPFAGSGALIQARLDVPAASIIYNDLDLSVHRAEFSFAAHDRRVRLLAEDAFVLPSIDTGTVDAIVTDPPWGEHEQGLGDYSQFVERSVSNFRRILNPRSGRAVVLINRRNEDLLVKAFVADGFDIYDVTQILVNGHPASAVRARI